MNEEADRQASEIVQMLVREPLTPRLRKGIGGIITAALVAAEQRGMLRAAAILEAEASRLRASMAGMSTGWGLVVRFCQLVEIEAQAAAIRAAAQEA